jgi:hypothetical protein
MDKISQSLLVFFSMRAILQSFSFFLIITAKNFAGLYYVCIRAAYVVQYLVPSFGSVQFH